MKNQEKIVSTNIEYIDLKDKNEVEKFNIILDKIFNNKHKLIDNNNGYRIIAENKLCEKNEIDSIGFMHNFKYNRGFNREEKLYVWLSKCGAVNVEPVENIINISIEN